jgi:hypothetical protein
MGWWPGFAIYAGCFVIIGIVGIIGANHERRKREKQTSAK